MFAGGVHAGADGIGVAQVEREKLGDVAAVGGLVVLREEFFVAGAQEDGAPMLLDGGVSEALEIEEELEIDVEEAGEIFGALDVTAHPIERVRDAGEHHGGLRACGGRFYDGHGRFFDLRFWISDYRGGGWQE